MGETVKSARTSGSLRRKRKYSTSTLIDAKTCVPWLAADGPLAYTPERPPATDYFFQYTWILPEIFNSKTNRRRHYYFGEPIRDDAEPLFEFWRQARRGEIRRVYYAAGSFDAGKLSAPIAVYQTKLYPAQHELLLDGPQGLNSPKDEQAWMILSFMYSLSRYPYARRMMLRA